VKGAIMAQVRLLIKQIAESKGIGQGEISDKTKLHVNTIKRLWKNPDEDVPNVDLDTLEKIAAVLGVTAKDLIA
jgi:DNA-binding Xre family transcriptional regulator